MFDVNALKAELYRQGLTDLIDLAAAEACALQDGQSLQIYTDVKMPKAM